jgi:hypothetical protein
LEMYEIRPKSDHIIDPRDCQNAYRYLFLVLPYCRFAEMSGRSSFVLNFFV